MRQSPSWEFDRFSASQEISRILWNPEVQYRIHKSLQPFPILTQVNPVHAPRPTTLRPILILSYHLRLGLPSGLFPSGFFTKTPHARFLSPIRATCPAHVVLLNLTTRIVFGDDCRSESSSLRSLLHFPVTSSLVDPNIVRNTLSSKKKGLTGLINWLKNLIGDYV